MDFARARRRMVDEQLIRRGLRDPRVLAAMAELPRHAFVPADWQEQAYADSPLPLGPGATISQPYIVALMLEKAELAAGDRVLEVGTGSGYQAALLAELGAETYSIELDPQLAARAARALAAAGYPRGAAARGRRPGRLARGGALRGHPGHGGGREPCRPRSWTSSPRAGAC